MAKLVVSENLSLDGVVEDPTGEQGFLHGGWFDQSVGGDREAWAKVEYAEALRAAALLIGRRTDEYFGSRWNSRSGDWPDRLNGLPKYVVSTTLEDPVWVNSTVLSGDIVAQITKLKREIDGEIVVYASRQLVHTLMEHDLVDELRLIVFPVVLGSGERLFGDTEDKKPLHLCSVQAVGDGLMLLTYGIIREV